MKIFLALFLVAGLAVAIGCDKPEPLIPVVKDGPTIGEPAPEIVGIDLEGIEFRLSDYRGQVILLNFYGDW